MQRLVHIEVIPYSRDKKLEIFDAIIIGTGQAGPALASRLCASGKRVAIIERNLVGGTCVNVGCTPTKTMVACAYAVHMANRARDFGVILSDKPKVDMSLVRSRVEAIVEADRIGLENWLSNTPGCSLVRGHARFENSNVISVGERLLSAPNVFINVGARALIPNIPGLRSTRYLTNSDMVTLSEVPRHLVILGGSYIGLEFAQMFRRFGSDVTVIERSSKLIPREDEEISSEVKSILENEDIVFKMNADCLEVRSSHEGIKLHVNCGTSAEMIEGSHFLVAVGRQPNTDDLGLHNTNIKLNTAGYICVDDQLRTSVPGIWALGDCNGRGGFTHTAYNDFEIVAANLLCGETRTVTDRIPAYALFIDPPLARVGITAAEAKKQGRTIRVGTRPMSRVARAIEKGETRGSMRIVVDANSEMILGAAILGIGGDEAIHEVLSTMVARAPYVQLATTMAIHPTVSELIPTILSELSPPY